MSTSGEYIEEVFCDETELQKKIKIQAAEMGKAHLSLNAVDGKLLSWLCGLTEAKNVLEIGGFIGYSATWLLRAMPADGRLVTLEKDDQLPLQDNLASDKRVSVIFGDAMESLSKLEGPFDFVFIDANKSAYSKYLQWCVPHMSSGGVIAADNSLLFGGVYGEPLKRVSEKLIEKMKEFNRLAAQLPGFETTMIPTVDGLTVCRKLD